MLFVEAELFVILVRPNEFNVYSSLVYFINVAM